MNNFHSLSHNEKIDTLDATQKGLFAHSEGYQTLALGNASHAEGQETQALDNASHAEGRETLACGKCTHAQGFRTKAIGDYSVSMGCDIEVTGKHSVGIQLNKNPNCGCLAQANTFAVVGGKVGINTLSPQHDFEVKGSTLVSSEAENVVVKTTTGKMYYVKNLSTCEEMCSETPPEGSEVVVKDDLEAYVTESELSTTLEAYVKQDDLNTTLEAYVKQDDLNTTLEAYVTEVDMEMALESYVKQVDLDTTLETYVKQEDLDATLQQYAMIPASTGVAAELAAGTYTMANGEDIFNWTLTGDVELSPPVPMEGFPAFYDGQRIVMRLKQDATGSRLLTLSGNFNVPSSITLTLSTDPDALDIVTAMYDIVRDKWDIVDFKTGY